MKCFLVFTNYIPFLLTNVKACRFLMILIFFLKAIQMYFLKQRFLEITNILRLEVPLIKHNFFSRVKCFQSSFQKEKKNDLLFWVC